VVKSVAIQECKSHSDSNLSEVLKSVNQKLFQNIQSVVGGNFWGIGLRPIMLMVKMCGCKDCTEICL